MTDGGIVFVTPWLGTGGIERTLEVKLPWFAARGHAVHLAAWEVGRLPEVGGPPVVEAARRAGASIHLLAADGRLGSVQRAARLLRLMRRHGLRVAIGHELMANVVVALAKVLSGGRIRAVLQFHNEATYRAGGASRSLLALAKWLLPVADEMVAVSEHLRRQHAAFLGQPLARVRTVYNPFPLPEIARLAAEPAPAIDALGPFVVACGRLTGVKGFDDLITAFAAVRRMHPARLVILGDGPDRAALSALAARCGLAEDVVFPGFAGNPFAYFSRAACFVLSSRSEGLANVVLEAMACGAPVVASDCGGIAEIIEPGRTGLVYRPGDIPELARLMAQVLAAPAEAADLAVRGRARVAAVAGDRILPRLEALYFGRAATWAAAETEPCLSHVSST